MRLTTIILETLGSHYLKVNKSIQLQSQEFQGFFEGSNSVKIWCHIVGIPSLGPTVVGVSTFMAGNP